MAEFSPNSNGVLDIHGREIPTILGPQQEVLCSLSDVKQTGVHLFKKKQCEELWSTVQFEDKDFGPDFDTHMIAAASDFMLANRIHYTDKIIMNSIESCKRFLKAQTQAAEPTIVTPTRNILSNNRQIESSVNDDIVVKVANPLPLSHSTPNVNTPRKFPPKGYCLNKTDEEKVTNGRKQPLSPSELTGPPLRHKTGKLGYNMEQKEVTAVVTAIDKPNCVWVRDMANTNIFEAIFVKTNEEAKYQSVAKNPLVLDKMYMAREENWFRCKIMRFSPLTVCFVDYGTVGEVNELREVSPALASAPCLAVRITFKENEYTPRLQDTIRIKIILKNKDGTYFVNVLATEHSTRNLVKELNQLTLNSEDTKHGRSRPSRRPPVKNPQKLNLNSKQTHCESSSSQRPVVEDAKSEKKEEEEPPRFFTMPPFFCKLEDQQRVAIAGLKGNTFYLRSMACFEKLQDIEKSIEKCVRNGPTLRRVEMNQLVLFKNRSNGVFYRAVVTKVEINNIQVNLLDYTEKHVAHSVTQFKAISEELSREPIALCCGGVLSGYEDRDLDGRAIEVIIGHIAARKKFTVTLGFDDEMDLYDGTQCLSKELANIPQESQKIFLKDTKPYKPEFGIKSYVLYGSSTDLKLVSSEKVEEFVDYIIKTELDDDVPYAAQTQELCRCLYNRDWYRGAVLEDRGTEYKMFLFDFGHIEFVNKKDVRRPDEKMTEIPALAIPCVLTGLPQHDNVDTLLKQMIIEGEVYYVDVKEFKEGKYHVEIPSVYKKIRTML